MIWLVQPMQRSRTHDNILKPCTLFFEETILRDLCTKRHEVIRGTKWETRTTPTRRKRTNSGIICDYDINERFGNDGHRRRNRIFRKIMFSWKKIVSKFSLNHRILITTLNTNLCDVCVFLYHTRIYTFIGFRKNLTGSSRVVQSLHYRNEIIHK